MATLAVYLGHLRTESAVENGPRPLAPTGTRIGHVHLQVSDVERAEAFYNRVLGFEVTVREYPSALFVSAGRYHRHIGVNTWHSAGALPPPPGSIGLRSYEVKLPNLAELERLLKRLRAAGIEIERHERSAAACEPSGNRLELRVR